jgi:hypothetical protein
MTNLRERAEQVLATSLEDRDLFALPIFLTYPDGEIQELSGQVVSNTQDADGLWTGRPAVTLRRSSLSQELDPTKPLFVRIPKTPSLTADLEDYVCDKPPRTDKGLGIVSLRLTKVEQSEDEE